MEKYDIVIATPGSMLTAPFVRSLTKTIKEFERLGISWHFVNYESTYIRYARESIINYGEPEDIHNQIPFAGMIDYQKIMWIDSDIEWEPEQLLSLYYSPRDIISGCYMMINGMVAASIDGLNFLSLNEINLKREIQLGTCGFGFVCVKKGVFEKMPKPWFDSGLFEQDGKTITILGEDNSWCKKAQESGFKIWLDPQIRVIHHKTVPLFCY